MSEPLIEEPVYEFDFEDESSFQMVPHQNQVQLMHNSRMAETGLEIFQDSVVDGNRLRNSYRDNPTPNHVIMMNVLGMIERGTISEEGGINLVKTLTQATIEIEKVKNTGQTTQKGAAYITYTSSLFGLAAVIAQPVGRTIVLALATAILSIIPDLFDIAAKYIEFKPLQDLAQAVRKAFNRATGVVVVTETVNSIEGVGQAASGVVGMVSGGVEMVKNAIGY